MSTDEMAALRKRIDNMDRRIDAVDRRLDGGEAQFAQILLELQQTRQAVQDLNTSTAGVTKAFTDVQGAARVGSAVWAFVLWCGKVGGVLVFVGYAISWVIEQFKHAPPGQ
jgi:hypothetical protein